MSDNATSAPDKDAELIRAALEAVRHGLIRKEVPEDIATFAVRPSLEALDRLEQRALGMP